MKTTAQSKPSPEDASGAHEENGSAYSVPPVHRAFTLLRHIAKGEECRNASATARKLGINRTTLIRLLHTLEAEGMIESADGGASWRLGSGMIALAADALKSRSVIRVAQPVMARLAETLRLSSYLGVLEGREVVYLLREAPNSPLVSNIREGSRLPAHATTLGRVLLARLPGEQLRALYANARIESYSDKTPTTLDALERQLVEDRELGYAWSAGNFEDGVGSCAAPVFDHRGAVVAALNVIGPIAHFEPGSAIAATVRAEVMRAAEDVSSALGHVANDDVATDDVATDDVALG